MEINMIIGISIIMGTYITMVYLVLKSKKTIEKLAREKIKERRSRHVKKVKTTREVHHISNIKRRPR